MTSPLEGLTDEQLRKLLNVGSAFAALQMAADVVERAHFDDDDVEAIGWLPTGAAHAHGGPGDRRRRRHPRGAAGDRRPDPAAHRRGTGVTEKLTGLLQRTGLRRIDPRREPLISC
jgi:hypothetical protein